MPKPAKTYYSVFHKLSGILMILALLWLTVSTPFVFARQLQELPSDQTASIPLEEEDCPNPFSNTTEEKTESGVSTLSEEYLHQIEAHSHHFTLVVKQY